MLDLHPHPEFEFDTVLVLLSEPCTGKTALSKALIHLFASHGLGAVAVSGLISAKKAKCATFRAMAEPYQNAGKLVPVPHIGPLLYEMPHLVELPKRFLVLDGAPRNKEQVPLVAKLFSKVPRIIVYEGVAPLGYSHRVFKATRNAPDRADRTDAKEVTFLERVEEYHQFLPGILHGIKDQGWEHYEYNPARLSLELQAAQVGEIVGLQPTSSYRYLHLEAQLGLRPLVLAA